MNNYRIKGWSGYLAPIGAYLFFLMQFYVQAPSMFDGVSHFYTFLLGRPLQHVNPAADAILVSSTLFIPYILIVILYRNYAFEIYARLTVKDRIPFFDSAIGKITRYHEKPETTAITDTILYSDVARKIESKHVTNLMIDLLITDLRDAFQDLAMCPDIRVAIYLKFNLEAEGSGGFLRPLAESNNEYLGGDQATTLENCGCNAVLKMYASTEFDKIYEHSTVFGQLNSTGLYEGYCGEAWNTKQPVSGNGRRFWFFRDERYHNFNILDRNRSFMCLPVLGRHDNVVVAVISIDSGRSMDFLVGKDLRDTIYIKTHSIRAALLRYLDCLQ